MEDGLIKVMEFMEDFKKRDDKLNDPQTEDAAESRRIQDERNNIDQYQSVCPDASDCLESTRTSMFEDISTSVSSHQARRTINGSMPRQLGGPISEESIAKVKEYILADNGDQKGEEATNSLASFTKDNLRRIFKRLDRVDNDTQYRDEANLSSISSNSGTSILSKESRETRATSVTGDAKDLLVKYFIDDHELKSLVISALARMPAEKFMRNFCCLLKVYSESLKSAAENILETDAAFMIRRQRFYLARAVIERSGGYFANQWVNSQMQLGRRKKVESWLSSRLEGFPRNERMFQEEIENGESDSDCGSDDPGNEVNPKQVEQFLLKTEAFKTLKINLRSFIYPSDDVMQKFNEEPTSPYISRNFAEEARVIESTEEKSRHWSESSLEEAVPAAEIPVLTRIWRSIHTICHAMAQLINRPLEVVDGLLRPEIPPSYVRVSWICVRGTISIP
jgi:hypothetical protein